jgi:hypothetical protein
MRKRRSDFKLMREKFVRDQAQELYVKQEIKEEQAHESGSPDDISTVKAYIESIQSICQSF